MAVASLAACASGQVEVAASSGAATAAPTAVRSAAAAPSGTPATGTASDAPAAERRALLAAADPDLLVDLEAAGEAVDGTEDPAQQAAFIDFLVTAATTLGPAEREALLVETLTFGRDDDAIKPELASTVVVGAAAVCEALDQGEDFWKAYEAVGSSLPDVTAMEFAEDATAEEIAAQISAAAAAQTGPALAFVLCPEHADLITGALDEAFAHTGAAID